VPVIATETAKPSTVNRRFNIEIIRAFNGASKGYSIATGNTISVGANLAQASVANFTLPFGETTGTALRLSLTGFLLPYLGFSASGDLAGSYGSLVAVNPSEFRADRPIYFLFPALSRMCASG